jgi:hypothetical protein
MYFSRILVIAGLVIVGLLSRLMPHPPNFTSLNAMALFSISFFGNAWISFGTLFLTLFLSDFIIGFHSTWPFVYLSFGLIVLMGNKLKKNASIKKIGTLSLVSSALFFIVTNLGEWFSGALYPKTWAGLSACFIAAIPFFTTQVFGDLTFSLILFGMLHTWNKRSNTVNSHCSN